MRLESTGKTGRFAARGRQARERPCGRVSLPMQHGKGPFPVLSPGLPVQKCLNRPMRPGRVAIVVSLY